MKKLLLIGFLLFTGCSHTQNSPESLHPSIMTEKDKENEIQRTLDQVGVTLPNNWEDMSKEERGIFLLPVLMQGDISE